MGPGSRLCRDAQQNVYPWVEGLFRQVGRSWASLSPVPYSLAAHCLLLGFWEMPQAVLGSLGAEVSEGFCSLPLAWAGVQAYPVSLMS